MFSTLTGRSLHPVEHADFVSSRPADPAAGACASAGDGGPATAAVPSTPAVAAAEARTWRSRGPSGRDSARTPTRSCVVASRGIRATAGAPEDPEAGPDLLRRATADCRLLPPAPTQFADSRTSPDEGMTPSLASYCCVSWQLPYPTPSRSAVDKTRTTDYERTAIRRLDLDAGTLTFDLLTPKPNQFIFVSRNTIDKFGEDSPMGWIL